MNLWIYGAGQDRERKNITRTRTTRYVTLVSVILALALTAASRPAALMSRPA